MSSFNLMRNKSKCLKNQVQLLIDLISIDEWQSSQGTVSIRRLLFVLKIFLALYLCSIQTALEQNEATDNKKLQSFIGQG